MDIYEKMELNRLREILDKIKNTKVAVLGDICLDVYWFADMRRSELSRETPHYPLPVTKERMNLGGGGNVAANLAALNPSKICVVGVSGDDWRGAELIRLMKLQNIDSTFFTKVPGIVTNAYCKPLRSGISNIIYEDPRIDFCNYEPLNENIVDIIIASLDEAALNCDVLCVSDQLVCGVVTKRVREHVIKLSQNGLTVVVDSRDRIGLYHDVILKPNEVEAARAVGSENMQCLDDYADIAKKLPGEVIMTIGEKGSLYANDKVSTHIPARKINAQVDFVGAGDSFLSGFSLASAAGASRPEAAYFAGLCSEVTIQKIGTTGTASESEILKWYAKT